MRPMIVGTLAANATAWIIPFFGDGRSACGEPFAMWVIGLAAALGTLSAISVIALFLEDTP